MPATSIRQNSSLQSTVVKTPESGLWERRFFVLAQQEKYPQAIEILNRLVTTSPGDEGYQIRLATYQARLGQHRQ